MINIRATVLFVVFFVGVFFIHALVGDAMMLKRSIHHEFMDFENQLHDEYINSHARLARAARLSKLKTQLKNRPICSSSNPCGWAFYETPGKQVYSFLLNVCQCEPNDVCVKDHDDVSTYTFQYRCHENITEWTEVAPKEDFVPDGSVGYGSN
ncbi:hypothetical protein PV328_008162 [Microctonus aethiopoides]|uniref:Uncharacterized protein n=1 Tax=Microctonus aethiopoides TaxID=144406 RepID=A0AA39CA79_9HYME|nr:hypothetical protein PV328_008162 [Microctonus aethiopoides]